MSRKFVLRILLALFVVALPFTIHAIYGWMTAYPQEIVIATGPEDGRYHQIGEVLERHLEKKLGIAVRLKNTPGSLENQHLLETGQADLGFYQSGMRHFSDDQPAAVPPAAGTNKKRRSKKSADVAFVSNLYSEVVHLLIRRDLEFTGIESFRGKSISLGQQRSGDYVIGQSFLKHLGLTDEEIQLAHFDYKQVEKSFADQSLDIAIITSGIGAPVYQELLTTGVCRLESMPFLPAFELEHLALTKYTIPRGLYRTAEPIEPAADISTAAFRAQLLTHENVSTQLIREVTQIVLSEDFVRECHLRELFDGSTDYAQAKPEFAIHAGANTVYDPELRPFLNPDFVEATEGMRSFFVSMAIAIYLAFRWWKRYRQQQDEHQLDRYIRSLLDIERRQLAFDGGSDEETAQGLQKLLDEVTLLRQNALKEFSAHDLNEDRSTDCFLEMCHALSDKINAKLTRERLEVLIRAVSCGRDEVGIKPTNKT